MKYTSEQINSMSWMEWCETMADELNKASFNARGYNSELGRWVDNYEPYKAANPDTFILDAVEEPKEINYLKSIGLLNNDQCTMCGNPINGNPGRFTLGNNTSTHFLCQDCVNKGRRGQKAMGISLAEGGTGCILALLIFPYNLMISFIKI